MYYLQVLPQVKVRSVVSQILHYCLVAYATSIFALEIRKIRISHKLLWKIGPLSQKLALDLKKNWYSIKICLIIFDTLTIATSDFCTYCCVLVNYARPNLGYRYRATIHRHLNFYQIPPGQVLKHNRQLLLLMLIQKHPRRSRILCFSSGPVMRRDSIES